MMNDWAILGCIICVVAFVTLLLCGIILLSEHFRDSACTVPCQAIKSANLTYSEALANNTIWVACPFNYNTYVCCKESGDWDVCKSAGR